MDLLKVLMESAGSGGIASLGSQFGLNQDQTTKVLGQLLPALGRGMQRNVEAASGLEGLINGLRTGNHQRYLEDPSVLQTADAVNDGNSILGHIFGSKDVSRNVAAHAESQTGISAALIKKMLPMVAAMAMGALSKQTNNGRQLQADGGGLLGSLLDSDNDGSILDDVVNLARKFF